MSDAKNINEVSVITTVESGDYIMVSDITDVSLKRATVANVGKTLLGTTSISSIGDGTVTGAISALDASQITVSNGFVIGTSNASVTIPTATATTIGTATLPTAGLWLVQAYIHLLETSSTKGIGDRRAWIGVNETSVPANRYQIAAPDGTGTVASGIKIDTLVNASANTTVYFRIYQNSGSDMSTTTNGMYAAKLMNA